MGIESITDLQYSDKIALEKEFGSQVADTIKQLAHGNDISAVTPFSKPQV